MIGELEPKIELVKTLLAQALSGLKKAEAKKRVIFGEVKNYPSYFKYLAASEKVASAFLVLNKLEKAISENPASKVLILNELEKVIKESLSALDEAKRQELADENMDSEIDKELDG
ncbi:MAG: hypothetical protein ACKN9T_01170 [Candidatus Methylumidiphilus sp.]